MKLLFLIFVSCFSKSYITPNIEISNQAFSEILMQNPVVKPADERDEREKFTQIMAKFLNPGIYTVFDKMSGEAFTHISYSTNSCTLFDTRDGVEIYSCEFSVGYSKDIKVDVFNKVQLDVGVLLSNGLKVEYQYIKKLDGRKEILKPTYSYVYK